MTSKSKKALVLISVSLGVAALIFVLIDFIKLDTKVNPDSNILSPIVKKTEDLTSKLSKPDTDLAEDELLNILLLGIDRRSKQESAYRTDIMILLTIDKQNNKALITSIPRDLWYGNGRLNATYIQEGFEGLQDAFEEITGQRPTRYVLTDFEDFSWVVDAVGGVPVEVQTSFTDSSYPVDATKGYQTVQFTKGYELMDGERALIFSRSRKGDFDNGDWGRMKRQHLLLNGMLEALTTPKSFVCLIANNNIVKTEGCENDVNRDVINQALTTVTTGKMNTNFQLEDLVYLWDFYKQRDLYSINSLLLDYEYLVVPPAEQYGGAWVLAPAGGTYKPFHQDLLTMLDKGTLTPEPIDTTTTPEGNISNEIQQ